MARVNWIHMGCLLLSSPATAHTLRVAAVASTAAIALLLRPDSASSALWLAWSSLMTIAFSGCILVGNITIGRHYDDLIHILLVESNRAGSQPSEVEHTEFVRLNEKKADILSVRKLWILLLSFGFAALVASAVMALADRS